MDDGALARREADRQLIGGARRDPEEIRRALIPWLAEKMPDAVRIDLPPPRAPDLGGSSATFFIAPAVATRTGTRTENLVVRIAATGHRIYELPSLDREYRTMEALGRLDNAPVAEMLWYEADQTVLGAPFFVMRRVEGTVPLDRYHSEGLFADAAPSQRRSMWISALTALVGIHGADVGAFAFLDRPALGSDPMRQEMAVWDSYARWLGPPLDPAQARAQRWLHDNLPTDVEPCLSWGDARVPNMIFQDGECRAVLDWETVSLCGAENDLGWLSFFDWFVSDGFGAARLEGIPDMAESVAIWSAMTGRSARHLHWFELFATWRFSMIRDRALRLAGLDHMPGAPMPDPVVRRLEELMG